MSAVTQQFSASGASRASSAGDIPFTDWPSFLRRWWPLGLGVAALLGSTALRFSQSFWQQTEYEHSALLLLVALWLMWRERDAVATANAPASVAAAAALLIPGLLVYLLGVRVKVGLLEFGALIPIVAGALWLVGGKPLVHRLWFPLLFLLLAIPLPSSMVMTATGELKEVVSQAAEGILHLAGYPIARDGVTLRIGPYNLLLADACSGMNSLISLSAIGMLYWYLFGRRSLWHTVALLASILPIAVATNIARVMILTLITYHLGDEAGQGFLHEFAGFVMFVIALAMIALEDVVLGKIFRVPQGKSHGER